MTIRSSIGISALSFFYSVEVFIFFKSMAIERRIVSVSNYVLSVVSIFVCTVFKAITQRVSFNHRVIFVLSTSWCYTQEALLG